jgi:hypothetical protein
LVLVSGGERLAVPDKIDDLAFGGYKVGRNKIRRVGLAQTAVWASGGAANEQ